MLTSRQTDLYARATILFFTQGSPPCDTTESVYPITCAPVRAAPQKRWPGAFVRPHHRRGSASARRSLGRLCRSRTFLHSDICRLGRGTTCEGAQVPWRGARGACQARVRHGEQAARSSGGRLGYRIDRNWRRAAVAFVVWYYSSSLRYFFLKGVHLFFIYFLI